MKIGIMGAGSVGCFLGGRLLASGADARFIGRPRVQAELAANDLRLTGLSEPELRVPRARLQVATDPAALADSDIVLVCVKSGQTGDAGRSLAPVVRSDALVVSMQNGLRNADALRAAMPAHAVLAGIVGFNVVSKGEGCFHRGTSGPLAIELPGTEPQRARATELARLLEASGFEVELPEDIRSKQWSKLIMNLNNAVSALSGVPTPALLFSPGYRRVLRAIVSEALAVLEAAKIHPAKLGAIPVRFFPRVLALPTSLLRIVARAQLKMDPEARSSMWEDLVRGRTTEVDELNGEIVRLAESVGVQAPLNERIVQLVRAAEAQQKGSPELSAEQLWSALGASSS